MSDRQSFLQQRARLLQVQLQKRGEASRGPAPAPSLTAAPAALSSPLPSSSSASVQPSPPPSVAAAATVAKSAFSASVDVDSSSAHLRRPPKRAPPSLDSVDEPAIVKKAKVDSGDGSAVDPLDAFMSTLAGRMSEEEKSALTGQPAAAPTTNSAPLGQSQSGQPSSSPSSMDVDSTPPLWTFATLPPSRASAGGVERYYGDDEGAFDEDELDMIARDSLDDPKSKVKKKELHAVDHSTYPYIPIQKAFWIESRDIAALSEEEVEERRRTLLEGVKIRGKKCPRPFFEWSQCGLSGKVAEVVAACGYTRPFPIQAQAIPVIMSGRDCIACAKTGSGKCFARGTRLRLMTGECIAVEDVVGGEQLMGDDGLPRIVTPGSLTHGVDVLYEITPTWDGARPFTVNGAHILVLVNNAKPRVREETEQSGWRVSEWQLTTNNRMVERGRTFRTHARAQAELDRIMASWEPLEWEVSVEEYLRASTAARRRCQLVACKAIAFCNPLMPSLQQLLSRELGQQPSEQQLGYIAWWLGMWLAKGDDRGASISQGGVAPPDSHHHHQIAARLLSYQRGFDEPVEQDDQASTADHSSHHFNFDKGSIVDRVLEFYARLDRKRVPRALLCDSLYVRRSLLAGLIDGAGFYDSDRGRYNICCQHLDVIQTVKELAATLGLRNSAIAVKACSNQETGEVYVGHRLCISGDMWNVVQFCAATHKQCPRPGAAGYVEKSYDSRCYSFTLTERPRGEYFGFAVHGGANRRFLLEDYTVTHNAQPSPETGKGPIGLILGPTRELAVQIYSECRRFAKAVDLRVVCVYGGSGVAEQIASLKRGSDVIVATPGRLIDMLCANHGRVLQLDRVSYVVLDEADRMFDLGFEPQIAKILELIRPDRQLVMFSATFPPSVEKLARKTLKDGIEIVIGGRSVASNTITQVVEVRKAEDKFPRLLEILGKWYQTGSIIIFVDRQEAVDNLFRQLVDSGYPCLALHGGMDQADRDFTLSDFRSGQRSILVATSVVARGLDVKDCVLVLNFSTPNHYEDYVHRVGRTGRAGKKGTAITFIQPDEEAHAGELVRGLKESGQVVPKDLELMAEEWARKKKEGLVKWGSHDGFGGKGFKFDEVEEAERKERERILRLSLNPDADQAELQQLQDELKQREEEKRKKEAEEEREKQPITRSTAPSTSSPSPPPLPSPALLGPPVDAITRQLQAAKDAARAAALSKISTNSDAAAALAVKEARERSEKQAKEEAAERARAVAMSLAVKTAALGGGAGPVQQRVSVRVEINDYPQQARWAVTKKGSLDDVIGETGCSITAKGSYIDSKRRLQEGEERLYLLVEGESEVDVMRCRNEILRRLEETKKDVEAKEAGQFGGGALGGGGARGRYNLLLG